MATEQANSVQTGAVPAVTESKRWIAKAVAQMPMVRNALTNGMAIILKGTTNACVAEAITGQKVDHVASVTGRIDPEKTTRKLFPAKPINHLILEKGKVFDKSLADAVKKLKAGNVVMKEGLESLYLFSRKGICVHNFK